MDNTKWCPTRDELIHTFAQLAIGVGGIGFPRWERDLIVDLCYAQRDLQLALVGYEAGPPRPIDIRKHCEHGGLAGPVAKVVR